MTGTITWTPSPSAGVAALDLMCFINGNGGALSGILPTSTMAIVQGFNSGDTYDIYGVVYRPSGERAVSAHLTGVVPAGVPPVDPLLPITGLSITFQ